MQEVLCAWSTWIFHVTAGSTARVVRALLSSGGRAGADLGQRTSWLRSKVGLS